MSVGRGRGRGFAEVRETTLRRPGQSFAPKFSSLVNLIENLTLDETSSKVDDIAQAINDSIKNNSLKEVIEDLHNQALEDSVFGTKLAIACSDTKVYSINDCNLRLILLQTLQKDFEERGEIKKRSVFQFRNAVTLLGEVYMRLKINGKLLDILAGPLLQYLELLLEASEEEDIALVSSMILMNGQKIFETSPSELEDFTIRARGVLINRNLSARSRGALLFIIDLTSAHFALPEKLKEFYQNEIENLNINNINGKGNAESDKPKNKPIQPTADNNVGNVTRTPKQSKVPGFGAHEKSTPSAANERPVMPRAIRGAGAVDSGKDKNAKKSPRGKKDKLTDEQIWSSKQNTGSKVWGHDDRFDKDY
ncbi:uncharacterized protein LOC100679564 isoform X2 [Nasonia vitripennis]|uniref:CBP80/20-dependent translation initiation factor n=1 Tax=Nasonia vitripennis TaxID=7425 RepID=A0A7M7H5Z6_NASVI|nr:uncharacterized protein LOC100679564 isoform X2 [Nasonia vitripennis]